MKTHKTQNPKSQNLLQDTRGLSTVEYVILMAIVVIGAVGAWNEIGSKFKTKLGESRDDVGKIGNDQPGI